MILFLLHAGGNKSCIWLIKFTSYVSHICDYVSIDAYTSALVYVLLELVVSDNTSWLDYFQ